MGGNSDKEASNQIATTKSKDKMELKVLCRATIIIIFYIKKETFRAIRKAALKLHVPLPRDLSIRNPHFLIG